MKNVAGNVFPKQHAVKQMNILGARRQPFLFIIDFEMLYPIVLELPLRESDILFDIRGVTNTHDSCDLNQKIIFSKYPVNFERYKAAFDEVTDHIHHGNSYLVNLTQPSKIKINLSLQEIFYEANAKYKLCISDRFVVFSPETFITIEDNIIHSYPMKGTIDAAMPNASTTILNDPKEKAEHITIVDLIRNDMSIYAKNVCVKRLQYLDHITTNQKDLLQVSSEITGELPADYPGKIGDILFSLLPAGSISGAPKQKSLEIIKSAENYSRGYYTGVFGYFDGKKMDSAVMIRFIEKKGKELIYKSGGGITAMSDAKTEYQELINKIYVPVNRNH